MSRQLLPQALDLVRNPAHSGAVAGLCFLADCVLTAGVVWKIPYTEIDWRAYMQQIALFLSGERDYMRLVGDTGPLVYPAAHVWIYRALYALSSDGTDIAVAQLLFAALYLGTLALVMQTYLRAGVPPYVFPLLVLSKRLHSVFVLRLFNDCFAELCLVAAVACWQRRRWAAGSVVFSLGVGVKMVLLLALPAVGAVLWQAVGRDRALSSAAIMAQVQIMLAYPFLATSPRSYVARAFEFTRQFLFKWTVNWRFVGEEVFLSREFSLGLLGAHIGLLVFFAATRWLRPSQVSLPKAIQQILQPPPRDVRVRTSRRVTPDFVLTSILTAIIVGCLCARSLHYQFFAYIAWSTPFLLWRSGLHPVLIYAVWAVQEWAWNVYPSTDISSMAVVGCLAFTVGSIWVGTRPGSASPQAAHQHVD
nr:dol-P-Man:Man(5)GlcNAc(2)-PP-Dol alpha-1,3-mannosyltransferase-like [Quercus suber]